MSSLIILPTFFLCVAFRVHVQISVSDFGWRPIATNASETSETSKGLCDLLGDRIWSKSRASPANAWQ